MALVMDRINHSATTMHCGSAIGSYNMTICGSDGDVQIIHWLASPEPGNRPHGTHGPAGLAASAISSWKKRVSRSETVGLKTTGVEPIRLSRSAPGISEWTRGI